MSLARSLSRYSAKSLKLSVLSFFVFFVAVFFSYIPSAFASTTSGTINTSNKYAWGENIGWIDFNATSSAVTVTDSALTGYAYAENIGWISLNCSNTSSCGIVDYKVTNNAEGTLGGYAYSENAGWIDFAPTGSGVTIDSSGVFGGYAYGENIGWINFNADVNNTYPVTTDWRKASLRVVASPSTSGQRTGGGSGGDVNIIYNNRTPVNNTQTCLPGHKFNITTGQACTVLGTNNTVQSTDSSLARELISAGVPTGFRFNKNYAIGSSNTDILYLQVFLNRVGFPVAKSGIGSKGLENKRFGPATLSALIKFQKANNIKPAVGYLGPITRNFINSMK